MSRRLFGVSPPFSFGTVRRSGPAAWKATLSSKFGAIGL